MTAPQTAIIGGEVAYNWGDYKKQPGDSPTDTVADPVHRRYLIDTIRQLHCTQLRWVADYDQDDPAARAGGEEVQKTFGYQSSAGLKIVLSVCGMPNRAINSTSSKAIWIGLLRSLYPQTASMSSLA